MNARVKKVLYKLCWNIAYIIVLTIVIGSILVGYDKYVEKRKHVEIPTQESTLDVSGALLTTPETYYFVNDSNISVVTKSDSKVSVSCQVHCSESLEGGIVFAGKGCYEVVNGHAEFILNGCKSMFEERKRLRDSLTE